MIVLHALLEKYARRKGRQARLGTVLSEIIVLVVISLESLARKERFAKVETVPLKIVLQGNTSQKPEKAVAVLAQKDGIVTVSAIHHG